MKHLLQTFYVCCFVLSLGIAIPAAGQSVFINEIHYDNASTDAGEAIEVAGPAGTDLTSWSLVLYNGNNSAPYNTRQLEGVLADQSGGYGFYVANYPTNGLQNGNPDGVALVNGSGEVVQFLSYGGTITAASGPAAGLTSTDIGVAEGGATAVGYSLQLTGTGNAYTDFTWASTDAPNTFGAVNTGQSIGTGGGGADPGTDPETDPETDPDPVTDPEPATTLVFINEIHYDNAGTDTGEGVELAGLAGTNLTGWQLVLYNGNNGLEYSAITLTQTIPNQQAGFGTIFLSIAGLQNGGPDGVALVDADGNVVQFLSYEGTFTAANGPAAGLTSTDIGVTEGSSTEVGASLQLIGTGSAYEDFTWASDVAATYGAVNNGQTFLPLQDIVFINEIHYDNDGADTGEAIEIAGRAGTDLTGWSLVLYNGNNGASYGTSALSGTIPDQTNGFGFVTVTYPSNGLQNGSADGVALVNPDGEVVQFLSYEGSFTAVGGPADGLTSTDIGVEEAGSTPLGYSLQLTGAGFTYEVFTWSGPTTNTFGGLNVGQDFGGGTTEPDPDPEPQQVTIAEARAMPLNSLVIVSGTLTAANELGGPAYIQDSTGGIPIFDAQVHGPDAFEIGDSIQVTASVGAYNEMVQLVDVTNVESFGPATTPVAPVVVSISDITSALEGQLIRIPNATFTDTKGLLFPESNYFIKNGTDSLELRIDGDVESLVGREIPDDAVAVTGVLGSFRGTLQLLPRFIEDLPGTTEYVPEGTNIPITKTLDVMTWNMEFFGSTLPTFGPADVQLQLQNAVRLIDSVDADIIAVQEISDENLLQQLADMLGYERVCSDRYSYSFQESDGTFPEQKLCFLYNPEVITFVDDRVIFEALYDSARVGYSTVLDGYPVGSPSSFWSSGRLPYMITVDATVEGVTERFRLVNIHAKSGASGNDLERRRFDVQALNDTLDHYYPNDNIILLGDYNDDVDESIGGGLTTYSEFVEAENFRVVTAALSETGLRTYITQDNVIDHIAISDELYDNYVSGSAALVIPFSYIYNYGNTTSDHLAVVTRYELSEPLTLDAGTNQIVYRGYAPAGCATLTASAATGGYPDYTYTWSTGQTGESIQVCPEQTTVYTVTVTDARGNTFTDSVQVCVVDVSCGNVRNPKVQVNYKASGKSDKSRTLCVPEYTVPVHLALGATLGDGNVTTCEGKPVPVEEFNLEEFILSFTAYPNPVQDYLHVIFEKLQDSDVEFVFYNSFGQEVYKKSHFVQNGEIDLDVRKIRLSRGINYLKVNSKYGSKTLRIVKF
ncbi:endonuclease/exonuclease/phosphatase family protein [Pontibacter harenae]|uniref:endonuclease/exonuclease/phosphatase family protein n=1 Tax=Pontibacter harenae TaxID=2894083 RepID=UPI001E5D3630|nr:endonuclease/exonuclease/phosphatase family protein [Pontibacter harenae]MCC9166098.1 DUF5689 domain-containing protein [Pontibacter harenae]